MKANIDLKSQKLAVQLSHLYGSALDIEDKNEYKPDCLLFWGYYDLVYDYLNLNPNKEERDRAWKLSAVKISADHPNWNKKYAKKEHQDAHFAFLKEHRIKLAKSFMARWYLLDKYYTEGMVLKLESENGPLNILELNWKSPLQMRGDYWLTGK